jgi:uncharacterized protein YciU (UPF0263 family)
MENNKVNFTNVAYLAKNIGDILFYEKEMENLIAEEIVDVYTDISGTFYYQVNDSYFNQLITIDPNISRKNVSFKEICIAREIDEKIYDLYFRKI